MSATGSFGKNPGTEQQSMWIAESWAKAIEKTDAIKPSLIERIETSSKNLSNMSERINNWWCPLCPWAHHL